MDSAELALLPRLPDTAEELKSIALALEVDPAKVLKLGVVANERTVKTTDLSRYKIVVFATHGLAPGELNGLTQPALALSAPDVAGVEGDGLLTMEEILALKLDADWVVLSACNTGTGAGAGAEAASGLGRAFFYAGSRALLVTNWSVHSQSARQLTTELFRRQTDGKLARGEALRQACSGTSPDFSSIIFIFVQPPLAGASSFDRGVSLSRDGHCAMTARISSAVAGNTHSEEVGGGRMGEPAEPNSPDRV